MLGTQCDMLCTQCDMLGTQRDMLTKQVDTLLRRLNTFGKQVERRKFRSATDEDRSDTVGRGCETRKVRCHTELNGWNTFVTTLDTHTKETTTFPINQLKHHAT